MNKCITFYLRVLIYCIFLIPISAQAQQVVHHHDISIPVYNYTQLEPMLHPAESNDTTYIFNFWATYCVPCIKELPHFEQIGKDFADQKVKVILISMDFKSKIATQVVPFIKKHQLKSSVILLSDPDANSWINKINPQWSGSLPATLIVKGNKREFNEKTFTFNELELLTTKFLTP